MAFAKTAGLVLDEWQALILDVILRERADGMWCARDAAYLCARQNGKGGVLDALCLAALFLFDDEIEILFSAHEFKTAKKAYRGIKSLIQGAPHLFAQVERRGTRVVGFRQSNEDTSITLQSGHVLRFMARSNNTARGFSPQRVIADEAQECSEDTRQALQYTIRAQANPQIVWCGTVPTPRNNGEVFKSLRDRGRRGGDQRLAWLEWSPEPGCDLRSDEAIVASNPAMPHRITYDTIVGERDAAETPEAFAGYCREALSEWPDDVEAGAAQWRVVPEDAWNACLSHESKAQAKKPGWLAGAVSLAVELTADRSVGTVAVAGACREGGIGADIVARDDGSGWIVAYVQGLLADEERPVARVVIDPRSVAASLIPDFEAAGVEVLECPTTDLVKATGSLIDSITSGGFRHRGSPELSESVGVSELRKYGEAFLLDRWGSGDPTPFIAVDLARWGHLQGPSDSESVYESRGLVSL